MKKTIVLILILSLTKGFAQKLTNATQVIDKYLEVTKIKANADKITDMTFSYTSETPRGVSEAEFKYLYPYKCKMTIFANGLEIMTSKFDGEKFERKSNWGAGQNKGPKVGYEAIVEANKMNPFVELNYVNLKFTPTLLPNETIDGKDYYVVEVKDSTAKSWKDYYDVNSGFKTKTVAINETPRGKEEAVVLYEDYKAFKGSDILFSAVKKQKTSFGEVNSELQSIKFNKGLKPKDFEIN